MQYDLLIRDPFRRSVFPPHSQRTSELPPKCDQFTFGSHLRPVSPFVLRSYYGRDLVYPKFARKMLQKNTPPHGIGCRQFLQICGRIRNFHNLQPRRKAQIKFKFTHSCMACGRN